MFHKVMFSIHGDVGRSSSGIAVFDRYRIGIGRQFPMNFHVLNRYIGALGNFQGVLGTFQTFELFAIASQ